MTEYNKGLQSHQLRICCFWSDAEPDLQGSDLCPVNLNPDLDFYYKGSMGRIQFLLEGLEGLTRFIQFIPVGQIRYLFEGLIQIFFSRVGTDFFSRVGSDFLSRVGSDFFSSVGFGFLSSV